MRDNHIVPTGLEPLAILGVTASGKSAAAMAFARTRGDIELVSVDSMQVYRHMDIGTAKPSPAERAEIPHHVLDLVDPWEEFDVARFQRAVADALSDIAERGRRAVLVGGTGLYLRSIVDALEIPGRFPDIESKLETEPDTALLHQRLRVLDPAAADRIEVNNRRRIIRALEVTLGSGRPFSSYGPGLDTHPPTPVTMIGVNRDRAETAERIRTRFHHQITTGFVNEVAHLRNGPPLSRTAARALGYRELFDHLDALAAGQHHPSLDTAIETAITRIRQFAVRQDRWFRRDPRITWLTPADIPGHLQQFAVDRW